MNDSKSITPKIKSKNSGSIEPDEFLVAEYNYLAQNAFQANEDRARVTNFFLVTIGGIIAAIIGGNFSNQNIGIVNLGFMAFFALLTIQGWLTLLQLAKLRLAWFSSIKAMNQIKNYYLAKYKDFRDFEIFEWNETTFPKLFDRKSVGYYLALQVSILTGITTAASISLAVIQFGEHLNFLAIASVTFGIATFLSIRIYRGSLLR